MLEIKNLTVKVGDKLVLNGISFAIEDGQTVAFMGPNGSGKSSLALTLAGHPAYEISDGKISWLGENINGLSVDQRAKEGIMLSMQYPVAISGLSAHTFLWRIYKLRTNLSKQKAMSLGDFRIWLSQQADLLKLNHELLRRNLNEGFSGGEKKKMEVLQILCARPKLLILDEIDSGLDVDALKIIGKTLAKYKQESGASLLLITHYSRVLKYIKPDVIKVLVEGKIVKSGGEEIAGEIEEKGY
jgi:Fe-S cluster assembly ATP-binding protein